jgi:isopenicillin-N N-acyltransferase-like protein
MPVHVLARCILEDCRSVEDVARLIRRSPRSASVCFSVAAATGNGEGKAASFEVTPTGMVAVPPDARGFLAHTNHMVGERQPAHDPLYENSIGRLTELSRRLGAVDPESVAVERLAEVLSIDRGSGFPIFRRVDPAAPWLERTATLATLVYDVTAKRLWLRSGLDPADDLTEVALPGRRPVGSPA